MAFPTNEVAAEWGRVLKGDWCAGVFRPVEDIGVYFPEERVSVSPFESRGSCFLYEYCQRDEAESNLTNFAVIPDEGLRSERIFANVGAVMHVESSMLSSFSSTRKKGYLLRRRDALLHLMRLFFNTSDS